MAFLDFLSVELSVDIVGCRWPESDIFSPQMFGSAIGSPDNDYQISDGWFANVSSILDVNDDKFDPAIQVNHNAYGYVTASNNYQVRSSSSGER